MSHGIRQDIFTPREQTGRMSREAIDKLAADTQIGVARRAMTLAHQSRAAMADGDIEEAARIEQIAASLTQ